MLKNQNNYIVKSIKILFISSIILTLSIGANAQFRVYHQLGGSIGPALINGDWGKNSGMAKVFGYSGAELNLLHNMQLVRERIGLRSNLGISYITNKHSNDEWTGEGNPDPSEQQNMLAAMSGTSMIVSLGTQVEYNFLDFGMYYPRNTWTPYVSAGFNLLYYMNDVKTPKGIPKIYENGEGLITNPGLTSSFKGSLGAKFKFSRFISFFGEYSLQRAFSDKVDGLVPSGSLGTDYLSSLNFGVMYSFR